MACTADGDRMDWERFNPDERMTIDDLRRGDTARIDHVEEEESHIYLSEMGCLPGRVVRLMHRAPLGDPLAIDVAGYRLMIRREDARRIHVTSETA